MKLKISGPGKSWWFPIILLGACYALSVAGPLSVFILPLIFWGIFTFVRRATWGKLALLLLASPFVIGVILATIDYSNGQPRLYFHGLPSVESWNIDPETRCFYGGGGCRIRCDEWVIDLPHNNTLHLLSWVFGPPAKSYDGPYPDKETAARLVDAAPTIDTKSFAEGKIRTGDREWIMPRENVSLLTSSLGLDGLEILGEEDFSEFTRIKAVLLGRRCLIVKLIETNPHEPDKPSPEFDGIVLIDTKTMRPFCYYLTHPRGFSGHAPKLSYLAKDAE